MITYKEEVHLHSRWPFWFKAHGSYQDWDNSIYHPLRLNSMKISDWLWNNNIVHRSTGDGACYKFKTQSDLTFFLMKFV